MEGSKLNTNLVVAVVGHIKPGKLKEFTDIMEKIGFFHVVFFKTSSNKLWIKEGDAP